mmetsp:Transcript_22980/g.59782  ORF Transcript_22980/g.59782 Transcript_22980/m.59782 type:complete len:308 (-) Transcript_22980:30-953(-)
MVRRRRVAALLLLLPDIHGLEVRAAEVPRVVESHVPGISHILPRREAVVRVLLLHSSAVAARQDPDRGARSEEARPARPGPAVRDRIAHGRDVLHPGKASRPARDARGHHHAGRAGGVSRCDGRESLRACNPRDYTGASLLGFAPRFTRNRGRVLLPARGAPRHNSGGNRGRPARVCRLRGTPHRDAGEERGPGRGARPRRCGSLLRRPLPAGVVWCVRVALVSRLLGPKCACNLAPTTRARGARPPRQPAPVVVPDPAVFELSAKRRRGGSPGDRSQVPQDGREPAAPGAVITGAATPSPRRLERS